MAGGTGGGGGEAEFFLSSSLLQTTKSRCPTLTKITVAVIGYCLNLDVRSGLSR